MATGLRDEIKTMRGRRQEAGGAQRSPLIDGSLSLSLSLPLEARQEGEVGTGRTARERRGEKGQAALGLHRCTNSGNCLSSKRRSFSSQGSNWTCQTVHLHGNDYFLLCSEAEPEAPHLYRRAAAQHSHRAEQRMQRGCVNAPEWFSIEPIWPIILQLFPTVVHDLTAFFVAIQTDRPHCAIGL